MNRTPFKFFAFVLAMALAVPAAYAVQPQATDLTKLFHDGGVNIDRLQVVEIGGIVVIRGFTNDPQRAADAASFAQSHGYTRVANLVQVTTPVDDSAIQRKAERALTINRGLDGTSRRIASRDGVVHLSGRITNELQRDMAVNLVRNIDGVRAVNADGIQR